MNKYVIAAAGIILILACSPSPEPIEYGIDNCAYCQMTIVDKQYGAELVSDKGKIYKYDAIECMVHHQKTEKMMSMPHHLNYITAFDMPGTLHPADSVVIIRSKALPSPMGMFLTAFTDHGNATSVLHGQGAIRLSYRELVGKFNEIIKTPIDSVDIE
jgi:copper chaperone NosL